jgi:hypothetical protein
MDAETIQLIVQGVLVVLLALIGIPPMWTLLLHGDSFYPEASPFEGDSRASIQGMVAKPVTRTFGAWRRSPRPFFSAARIRAAVLCYNVLMNYHRYHKGFATPLLLIIIATLLLGGGVYVYQQTGRGNQSAAITTAQTANQEAAPAQGNEFIASPTAGVAPLSIHFSIPAGFECLPGNLSCAAHPSTYTIDYGDGTDSLNGSAYRNGTELDHTYTAAGNYVATLIDTTDNKGNGGPYPIVGTVTIKVTGHSQTVNWTTYKSTASDVYCVGIYTKEFGSVHVAGRGYVISYPPGARFGVDDGGTCGQPTGIGTEMIRLTEDINVADKQYKASGYRESDNSFGFSSFGLTPDNKILVTYGVNHSSALTDSEYQSALTSAKEIVATLELK